MRFTLATDFFNSAALRDYFTGNRYYSRDETADPASNAFEKNNVWLIQKIDRIQRGAHPW